jgi:hypothetical protein
MKGSTLQKHSGPAVIQAGRTQGEQAVITDARLTQGDEPM